jgi:hypothetical protein
MTLAKLWKSHARLQGEKSPPEVLCLEALFATMMLTRGDKIDKLNKDNCIQECPWRQLSLENMAMTRSALISFLKLSPNERMEASWRSLLQNSVVDSAEKAYRYFPDEGQIEGLGAINRNSNMGTLTLKQRLRGEGFTRYPKNYVSHETWEESEIMSTQRLP